MIYCCKEHVELALDVVVDDFETFPILTEVPVDKTPKSCEYCGQPAAYIVANK